MADATLMRGAVRSSPVIETQRELERAREQLRASAHDLRADVKALVDWRRPLRDRPWVALGAALAIGFIFASFSRPRGYR